jgi:hypothetical protein
MRRQLSVDRCRHCLCGGSRCHSLPHSSRTSLQLRRSPATACTRLCAARTSAARFRNTQARTAATRKGASSHSGVPGGKMTATVDLASRCCARNSGARLPNQLVFVSCGLCLRDFESRTTYGAAMRRSSSCRAERASARDRETAAPAARGDCLGSRPLHGAQQQCGTTFGVASTTVLGTLPLGL